MKETINWVDVKDRLPDDDLTVLVCHSTMSEPVWFGFYHNNRWHVVDGRPLSDGVVISWAELPVGPSAMQEDA